MDEDSNGSRDSGRGESLLSSSPSPPADPLVGPADGEGEGRGGTGDLGFPTPPPRLPSQKKTRPRVNKGPPPYVIWQANLQKSRLASSLLILRALLYSVPSSPLGAAIDDAFWPYDLDGTNLLSRSHRAKTYGHNASSIAALSDTGSVLDSVGDT